MVCGVFFSSRRRHTRWPRDWSSDVCSSDLLGGLGAEGEDPGDRGAVVDVICGGAVDVGLMQGASELTPLGVSHEGDIGGEVQGEAPAIDTCLLCGRAGTGDRIGGEAGEVGLVGDVESESVRRVEEVIAELSREF